MYDTCTSRYLKLLQSGHLDELTPESLYNLIYDSFDTSILKTRVRNEYYTFSITTTLLGLSQTDLSNSQITSRTIKDALTQSLLDQYSTRPSVDAKDPDVPFFVTIKGDGSIGIYVSLISKNSNHVLRGYRGDVTHKGSLRATTAALLGYKSGVTLAADAVKSDEIKSLKIVDPMTGSGTLLLESFLLITGISPYEIMLNSGWRPCWERFGFGKVDLRDIERRGEEGRGRLNSGAIEFIGNDKVGGNLKMVQGSCEKLGIRREGFRTHCNDISDFKFDLTAEVIISLCNPPWPEGRIGGDDPDLIGTWSKIGEWSKSNLKGNEIWVLAPPTSLSGELRMKARRAVNFRQGKEELRWSQYLINE